MTSENSNPAQNERPESKSPMGEEIGGGPVAPPGDTGGVINPAPGSGEGHPEVAENEEDTPTAP